MIDALFFWQKYVLYSAVIFFLHGYWQLLRHFHQDRLDIELSVIEAVNSSAQPKN
jgi:hypothetical protein